MLTSTQMASWERDGFLVIPDAVDMLRCWELMERAAEIVADFDPSTGSVFSTNEQTRTSDGYFLASGDRISCFFDNWLQRPDLPLRGFDHG